MSSSELVDRLFAGPDWSSEPGCAAAIIEAGTVVWSRCFGQARLAQGLPICPATRFRIASITKPMLALVVAALEDQSLLSLEDSAADWIPELRVAQPPTLGHLLSMKSGIREAYQLDSLALGLGTSHAMASRQQLALLLAQTGQNFAPGDRTLYCNANSILLQLVVERASNLPLGRLLERHVFEPAAMHTARLVGGLAHRLPETAIAYAPTGDGFVIADPDMVALAPGGVVASLEDMAAFWQWLRTNPMNWQNRLAAPVCHEDKSESGYAYGFERHRISDSLTLGHSGGHGGWSCDTMWLPDRDLAVVVLGNRTGINWYERAREMIVAWTGIAPDAGCTPRLVVPVRPEPEWDAVYGSAEQGFAIRLEGSADEIDIEGRQLPRQSDNSFRRTLGVEPVIFRFNEERSAVVRTEGNIDMMLELANPGSCPKSEVIEGTYAASEMPQPLIVHEDRDGRLRLAIGVPWPASDRLYLEPVMGGLFRATTVDRRSADLTLVFDVDDRGICHGLELFTSRILRYRFDRISSSADISWPERVESAPSLLDWVVE